MKSYPTAVTKLIAALEAFPGVGEKTAERYALFLLKQDPKVAKALADAVTDARAHVRSCVQCFNLAEAEVCSVCADPARDQTHICVVESPRELLTIERAGVWKGVYHVLCGRIAPTEGITESDLTIAQLRRRCAAANAGVSEVVIATNPDLGGDATALAVARALQDINITVSRLARGVPVGYQLDFLSGNVLDEAFVGRQPLLRRSAQLEGGRPRPPEPEAGSRGSSNNIAGTTHRGEPTPKTGGVTLRQAQGEAPPPRSQQPPRGAPSQPQRGRP